MIPSINLELDGDNCWPDLNEKELINIMESGIPLRIAVLDNGMASGHPSITLRIDLPDGKVLLTQTSARVFCLVAKCIMDKYPDLFDD